MRIIGIVYISDNLLGDESRILSVPATEFFSYHVHTENWVGGIWSFQGLYKAIGPYKESYETA